MLLTALKTQLAALLTVASLDTAELPGLSPEMVLLLDDLSGDQTARSGDASNVDSSILAALDRVKPLADAGDKDACYVLARWSLMTSAAPDARTIIRHYRRAASKGHVLAKCELAQVLIQAFPRDNIRLAEAIALLREAETAGHPLARRILAHLLITGAAAPILYTDAEQGRALLEKASAASDGGATLDLSCLHATEATGFSADPAKSAELLVTAGNQSNTAALNLRAALLLADSPSGEKQAAEEALKLLDRSTALGSATAHRLLGSVHARGLAGQSVDLRKAVSHHRKAASAWDPQSLAYLAQAYEEGVQDGDTVIVKKDPAEALKYFEYAADNGHAEAALAIGRHYDTGVTSGENSIKALSWYLLAANGGLPDAQHRVAKCYQEGHGGLQDLIAATAWYQRAADQLHIPSMLALGELFETGGTGSSRQTTAALLYTNAAELGSAAAMLKLAHLYESGAITTKRSPDLARALALVELAVHFSDHKEEATRYRDRLKAAMTAEEVDLAGKIYQAKKAAVDQSLANQDKSPALQQSQPKILIMDGQSAWRAHLLSAQFTRWESPFGDSPHLMPRLRLIATPADDQAPSPSPHWKRNLLEGPTPIPDLLKVLEEARRF